jgi:hypothetical protein
MKNKTQNIHKFSEEEKVCIAHAIDHLLKNKIANDIYVGDGWYSGNKKQFIKTHVKAIETLTNFLK